MYSTETELTNDILKLQADVLGEDVKTDHPYLKKNKSAAKSKQLITERGFIVGAINELVSGQDSLTDVTEKALATVYNVLGQIALDQSLKERVLEKAPSLIELVLQMNQEIINLNLNKFENFEDVFDVADDTVTFTLSKGNIDFNSIKVFVNGVYYKRDPETYSIDETANTVTWLLNEDNGGFSLKDSQVIINYNYKEVITNEEEPNNG